MSRVHAGGAGVCRESTPEVRPESRGGCAGLRPESTPEEPLEETDATSGLTKGAKASSLSLTSQSKL